MLKPLNETFYEIHDLLYEVTGHIDPLEKVHRQVRQFKELIDHRDITSAIRMIDL